MAKERWLAARRAELLPAPYFHLVFTLAHDLNALAQGNPAQIYGMLFAAASATLIEFGENPRWLGGEIAATLVLHTWGQNLNQHLHLHCLVAAGALHADGHWIRSRRGFLFPVQALSKVFRGKFLAALEHAFASNKFKFAGATEALADARAQQRLIAALRAHDWVVYAKRPFSGPSQVLDYLGRYTHRVALSNNRLVSFEQGEVRFRFKDYAHGNRHKVMCLGASEFIRRFLLHVLPKGFMRIRHYGILANRAKHTKLAAAHAALDEPAPATPPHPPESVAASGCASRTSILSAVCTVITVVCASWRHWLRHHPVRKAPRKHHERADSLCQIVSLHPSAFLARRAYGMLCCIDLPHRIRHSQSHSLEAPRAHQCSPFDTIWLGISPPKQWLASSRAL